MSDQEYVETTIKQPPNEDEVEQSIKTNKVKKAGRPKKVLTPEQLAAKEAKLAQPKRPRGRPKAA